MSSKDETPTSSTSSSDLPPKPTESQDAPKTTGTEVERAEIEVTKDNEPSAAADSEAKPSQAVEDDDETAVTMVDVLEEEKELEDDAAAVLGSADDQHCTYMSGGTKPRLLTCDPAMTFHLSLRLRRSSGHLRLRHLYRP